MIRKEATAGALAIVMALSHAALGRPQPGDIAAAGVKRLLARGDALLDGAFGEGKASWRALWFFRRANKLTSDSYQVLWRLARAHASLARAEPDKKTSSALGLRGYRYALTAIRRSPGRVQGHFWAAVCIGAHGNGLGVLTALAKGIRGKFVGHLDRALRIDPAYDGGGPNRIFAIYHHALPWPLRSNAKAMLHFRRALRYDADHPLTLYHFAEVLIAEDRIAEARRQLRRCVAASARRGRAEDRRFGRRCRDLMSKVAR